MRILILLDHTATHERTDIALKRIELDYAGVTPVSWDYAPFDYSDVKWVDYLPGDKGIDFDVINRETKRLWNHYRYKYDHVIFCIAPQNWKSPGIGGWNLGNTFYNYYPQIVKITNSDEWLYKIFAMEIFHAMDEIVPNETGFNVDRFFSMDFDNAVVHGENAKYGVPTLTSRTGYFTDYNYRPIILLIGEHIKKAYVSRELKHKQYVSQLIKLLELFKELLRLKRARPTPFMFGPHSH